MGVWSIVAGVEGLEMGVHLVFGGWGMWLGGCLMAGSVGCCDRVGVLEH